MTLWYQPNFQMPPCSLSSGKLSSSTRRETVQQVAAKMLSYCKYPTSRQFETVASKMVKDLLKGKGDTGKWLRKLVVIGVPIDLSFVSEALGLL